jgi:hypothetical protein
MRDDAGMSALLVLCVLLMILALPACAKREPWADYARGVLILEGDK